MHGKLHTARSADGTPIGYETTGAGAPLVLVHGGVSDRTYWAPVVPALAERFTVVSMDRRGQGASGDTAPYSIERECDDVAAVVDAFGEPVHLVGHSYGGLCALGAALRTSNLRTLTLYEPAIVPPGTVPEEFAAAIEALVESGERDAAVELMMGELVGLPADALAGLRADPALWQPMVDAVHTLPRELRTVMGFVFRPESCAAIDVPTALLTGSLSDPALRAGVDLVRGAVPGARVVHMEGVDHEAVTTGPEVLTAALVDALHSGQRV